MFASNDTDAKTCHSGVVYLGVLKVLDQSSITHMNIAISRAIEQTHGLKEWVMSIHVRLRRFF